MGLFDKIKNIMSIPEEDDFEEEVVEETAPVEPKKNNEYSAFTSRRQEQSPRIVSGGKSKTVNFQPQMQVVLVKPDRFEDVTSIADHLNSKKTVVLNLEVANREISRRIIDFLSGVAYANNGNIRKVANSTFIIVPTDVDVMGELMLDEFEEGKLYL